MDFKICNVRFSKDYFPDFETCAKWMDAIGLTVNGSFTLENYFVFPQVSKDKFKELSIQEYKLDNGVCAEIGMLDEDAENSLEGVNGTEPMPPEEVPSTIDQNTIFRIKAEVLDGFNKLFEKVFASFDTQKAITKAVEGVPSGEVITFNVPIVKANEDERIVYGEVLVPSSVDAQDHIYSAEEVAKAAHYWMKEYMQMGHMHTDMLEKSQISVIESYIAPVTFKFSETDTREVKKGTWLLMVYVEDEEIWTQVKNGELNGFSIGGVATVQDVE